MCIRVFWWKYGRHAQYPTEGILGMIAYSLINSIVAAAWFESKVHENYSKATKMKLHLLSRYLTTS